MKFGFKEKSLAYLKFIYFSASAGVVIELYDIVFGQLKTLAD
jgi:hypothetical protein